MGITGRRSNEIADSAERAIADGELRAGAALPPIRDLAGELGVNPNTVAAAYRMLRERGLVETAGRRGTHVRPHPLGAPRESEPGTVPPGVRDAATGNPDPRLLPDLSGALAAVAGHRSGRHALYGDPPLLPRIAHTAREIFEADGVPAERLAATSGALDAIDRVLRSSLRPGDSAVVEDPGWSSTLNLLTALGIRPVPAAIDDEGMLPDALAAALRSGARAVVVTDRAQNPFGSALSPQRAAALRAVLSDHPDVLTVDDDHGFGFVSAPFRSLVGATRRWALVRSVAKTYGPDLRLALLTGDAVTVERVRAQQQAGPGWVSTVLQEAFSELWRTGAVDWARTARSYDERREALVARLADHGVGGRGRSGVNVWVPVEDEAATVTALHARGWAVAPGRRFRLESGPGIRVTISAVDAAELSGLAADIAAATQAGGPPV
ncbi:aminotransferase class I/II-fold pyridoxal phosphate-dependent enzyme [Streptomonospora litoralis]|uniref:Putative HTH-type transcriptional regulator YdcR n=1 Tax=Streptomonospora litoralis TaxID=2498135 RepID=A0A4P6Q5J3_9ACTN|nr:aminotransferase class I/II-fold pyridoxal phosphate-dependent enzyme [Streptomonospora litoralis]QBI55903.1 putative HTH-type transcriptional regulator YdcR [Streptomonospora litoralis]